MTISVISIISFYLYEVIQHSNAKKERKLEYTKNWCPPGNRPGFSASGFIVRYIGSAVAKWKSA